jgi:hypothetical protein
MNYNQRGVFFGPMATHEWVGWVGEERLSARFDWQRSMGQLLGPRP